MPAHPGIGRQSATLSARERCENSGSQLHSRRSLEFDRVTLWICDVDGVAIAESAVPCGHFTRSYAVMFQMAE
jgi:hypothetical protein